MRGRGLSPASTNQRASCDSVYYSTSELLLPQEEEGEGEEEEEEEGEEEEERKGRGRRRGGERERMEELTEYTKMELLSEPQEEEEEEEKKKAEEEEEEEEEEVETDTANHTHTNAHTHTKENAHTIDFILVNRLTHTHPHTQTTHAYMEAHTETHIDLTGSSKVERDGEKVEGAEEERNEKWRRNFELELEREGLVLEEAFVEELPLRFVKIHAPLEVCTRYAEILKLRIPMKEKMDDRTGRDRVILHFPGLPPLEFRPPQVIQDVREGVGSLLSFTHLDPKIFPPANRHFTAIYARDKDYLFDLTPEFFRPSIKARIIDFIIRRKSFDGPQEGEEEEEEEAEAVVQEGEGGGGGRGGRGKDNYNFGIEKLLAEEVYLAAYPVHDGDLHIRDPPAPTTSDPPSTTPQAPNTRALLYEHWARLHNFYKRQPLDHIKNYFGVKIGLYFAWLGFYTYMLIPASIVGLFCFLYALGTLASHAPSNDICQTHAHTDTRTHTNSTHTDTHTTVMCPLCDKFCDFWDLSETCFHAKFTYLVDNPATIFFTAFMSLWAALFLELWKRYSAEITHRWDLTGFDIQEEHPRPQYLARLSHVKRRTINIVTKTLEPRPPFWRMRFPGVIVSLSTVFLLVSMALVAVMGVILYRMSVLAALSIHGEGSVLTSYALIFTSTTAACINLVCIVVFNQLYARLAERLTELELQRTQTEFDDSLTLKIYLLQFVNYYSSIFYIAFFKGKAVGYPGGYLRVWGYRQEECSPGGCLLELSVQLAIIMVGKQAMNTVVEMILPKLFKWYNFFTVGKKLKDVYSKWPRFAKDFQLVNFDPRGLFPEYLEMVLQYGFVTIFVSSFPLAPLFALLNNIFELRLDGQKLLTHYRRPTAQRVKDIGVWFKILDSIGKLAVVTNAFIIAFTSNFIPELVYKMIVSDNDSLDGFLDYSLSTFKIADYPDQYKPPQPAPEYCRYPDYRLPPDSPNKYKYAPIYWHILAARLAFIVVFENVVCGIIMFIKWVIPDMPFHLQEQIRREAYVTNEIIVEQELRRARKSLFTTTTTTTTTTNGGSTTTTPTVPARTRRRRRGRSWGGEEV